ncbi:MAG: hypothetical protein ATN34_05305 [Epulopiscium sp. Nele67-Bin002]|nr:MAG: hypothetical protein ATN33_01995 [Epulopiscium sp. Nele67-Bin001]OON92749.1 MAG: hypothetical protein ATN34_05305 [Epulopiscium sp. Nele67-Bin002]
MLEQRSSNEFTSYLVNGKKKNTWKYAIFSGLTVGATFAYAENTVISDNKTIVNEVANTLSSGEEVRSTQDETNIYQITSGPVLSVNITTKDVVLKQEIPKEIEYVANSAMYEDETKVVQEGQDGLKEMVVQIEAADGVEISRELLQEYVVVEVKNQIIEYGTKAPIVNTQLAPQTTQTQSTTFAHPLNGVGYISSSYGSRWGSFHNGIDIAAGAGTPIYAAAAGTVTYSGYMGTYGYLVIIDHGNGYETYYAHASALYAKVGQYVTQGQSIAAVGSTGNSTGNHLHFEIRENGQCINPYSYIY